VSDPKYFFLDAPEHERVVTDYLQFVFNFRQGNCRREDGNQDGSEKMERMIATDTLVDIGKLEKKGFGMEFLIYLVRLMRVNL
jgi:hypothetical protein